MAFDRRGGIEALLHWSNENPEAFYALWGKLLPRATRADAITPAYRFPRHADHGEEVRLLLDVADEATGSAGSIPAGW